MRRETRRERKPTEGRLTNRLSLLVPEAQSHWEPPRHWVEGASELMHRKTRKLRFQFLSSCPSLQLVNSLELWV